MEKKVLIIDDETDIREAMAEAIQQAGFSTQTAADGKVGLQQALADHPDLILLDIVMPIMDGHEFLRKLRQDPWGKDARVVVLTSMDDVHNIGSAHTGVIADYIIKAHSSLDEIVAKVRLAIHAE